MGICVCIAAVSSDLAGHFFFFLTLIFSMAGSASALFAMVVGLYGDGAMFPSLYLGYFIAHVAHCALNCYSFWVEPSITLQIILSYCVSAMFLAFSLSFFLT